MICCVPSISFMACWPWARFLHGCPRTIGIALSIVRGLSSSARTTLAIASTRSVFAKRAPNRFHELVVIDRLLEKSFGACVQRSFFVGLRIASADYNYRCRSQQTNVLH